ncbi:MAG: phage tail tape measure protein, partial [Hominilimicola sp.]
MADSTSVSIGFNTKEAQQEIKSLGNAMKQTQNEFKITDTTLKTTGSSLDRLKNKYQSLSTQLNQQTQITQKYKQMVEQASTAQEAARQRLEKANAAYEKGKSSLKGNSEEMQKLKNEVQKAQSAVNAADKSYEKWNNQLSKSKLAEANLRNELQQTSEALKKQSSYIAQVQEKYNQLNEKTAGVQKGLTVTGKTLTAGVTAPIVAAAAYAVKSFNAVDDGLDIVMTKTGATGEQAKELQDVYTQVANTIPSEFNDIGSAVGELNTRLEFTGDKLETASEDFLKFAKINGSDVNNSVQLVTRAMGDASIPADEYKSVLDALTVASQKSGISIESLTSNLTKYGAPMRALGLDISDSIALFAAWEKSGVNTEIAFSGMKKAISNWGKEGKDSRVEFQKTMQEIKDAPDIATATTKAIEVFGSKAGSDLADAIKGGRFEVSEYMEALQNAGGAVDNTYAMIIDGSDDAKLAAQKVQVALSGLGEQIMQSAGPALLSLAEDASELIAKFGE